MAFMLLFNLQIFTEHPPRARTSFADSSGSQSGVPSPPSVAAPGNLLEMQIFW